MRPSAPNDPREIGPYRVVALLGSGGMGRVHLGLGPDGTPAAVKVVRAEYAYDPGFRERFARELDLVRRVHGLFTPRVLAADTSGRTPWLATEYVMGPSLQELVQDTGPLPEETVRFMGRAIAQALERVHASGLVHRDLKPGNVMVAGEGPQVIDFGIAHTLGDAQDGGEDRFVGTPGFMSPEAVGGKAPGPPADVFALGGVLIHALTGRGPFGDGHPSTVLYRIAHLEPDLEDVPESLRGIVSACLAKDPASRPTAAQVVRDLGGPVSPAPIASSWLPPAAAERIAGIADEYRDAVATGSRAGGRGRLGGRLLIAGAAALALTMVAGLGTWTAGQAGLIGGLPGDPEEDPGVAQREVCSPKEHLAPEFAEAAEDELTPPNTDEGMFYTNFSSDGEVLAVAGTGGLALWDWREQTEVARIETEIPARYGHPTFSPNDCLLAYASDDGAHVYHLESGEHTVYAEGFDIGSIAFTRDGGRLVVGSGDASSDSTVLLYDLETGELGTTLADGPTSVRALAVSADGSHVVAQDWLERLYLWNVESGEIIAEGTDSPALNPEAVYFVDDRNLLRPEATGARRQNFTDTSDVTRFVDEDMEEDFRVHDVEYSLEADRVYVTYVPGDYDFSKAYMKVWEYSTGEDLTAEANEGYMHEISVHPEGEVLIGVPGNGNGMWVVDATELRILDRL
ncbi:serine/threonine-protein kinase [Nocardiopsis sp. LDBS1602]|uniref:serine/threonine-protein kinase n=1 Tax=Nocardiopsis sp. LDBS1602 TaxID=3109597 RepID=UPI002DBB0A62|nr:serine/threonine-protein kinase [Nocardiopsis sp. LDBS1602]MEC3895379.1 serine/threonine-protein kinase [Nocardiopsis sp. LDBS1602]